MYVYTYNVIHACMFFHRKLVYKVHFNINQCVSNNIIKKDKRKYKVLNFVININVEFHEKHKIRNINWQFLTKKKALFRKIATNVNKRVRKV